MDKRTCPTCETVFTPNHGRNRYCKPDCRKPSHAKVTVVCDCCGGPAVKYRRAQRYAGTYCGTLCRDHDRYGPTSCVIPKAHWARWFGRTSEWLPPLMRNAGGCDWCDQPNPRRMSAAYCSPRCKGRAKAQRRRARAFEAPGEYRYREVAAQYIALGRTCAYCQAPAIGLPEPDHVVALSRGGRNDITNIVAACSRCNADKRDLTLSAWRDDRARRSLTPVNLDLTGSRFPRLIIDSEHANIRSILS